jgi:hypothetical protein
MVKPERRKDVNPNSGNETILGLLPKDALGARCSRLAVSRRDVRVLSHESTATQRRGYNKTFEQHARGRPSKISVRA